MTTLVQRARDAGELRPEIAPQDMAILQMMLGAVVDVSRDVAPELWKRFLTLVLDGMRTGGTRASELGAPPVPVERIPEVMAGWQPLAR